MCHFVENLGFPACGHKLPYLNRCRRARQQHYPCTGKALKHDQDRSVPRPAKCPRCAHQSDREEAVEQDVEWICSQLGRKKLLTKKLHALVNETESADSGSTSSGKTKESRSSEARSSDGNSRRSGGTSGSGSISSYMTAARDGISGCKVRTSEKDPWKSYYRRPKVYQLSSPEQRDDGSRNGSDGEEKRAEKDAGMIPKNSNRERGRASGPHKGRKRVATPVPKAGKTPQYLWDEEQARKDRDFRESANEFDRSQTGMPSPRAEAPNNFNGKRSRRRRSVESTADSIEEQLSPEALQFNVPSDKSGTTGGTNALTDLGDEGAGAGEETTGEYN